MMAKGKEKLQSQVLQGGMLTMREDPSVAKVMDKAFYRRHLFCVGISLKWRFVIIRIKQIKPRSGEGNCLARAELGSGSLPAPCMAEVPWSSCFRPRRDLIY